MNLPVIPPAPCSFDHNGECLICDCWPKDCEWRNLWMGKGNLEDLIHIFEKYLTEEDKKNLRSPK